MERSIAFLFPILFFVASNGQPSSRWQSLDSALNALHQTHRFNGSVLYAERGKVLYQRTFGVADFRTGAPLQSQSAFNLASVTKQFVCMSIMMLKEQGKLQYDDACSKYLPSFPYSHISIRQLMQHTSGLPEYFDLFQSHRTPLDTLDNEKMLALFVTLKPDLEFEPGSNWQYCNTNYVLLVSIVEKITGQPFEVFFQEAIARPLGLRNTYVYDVLMRQSPANRVLGFEETGETPRLNELTVFDGVVGDGNIYSTTEDLLKWEQSLYGEKLVKQSTLAEAFKPAVLKNGETRPYGFGWGIEDSAKKVYAHTGGWVGFANVIYHDVGNQRTLVLLSSGSNGWGIRIARQFMSDKPLAVPPTTLIHNVQLVDGTGMPARKGAVRMEGQRILQVGNLTPYPGETTIDGKGRLLAPGFIDTHSHLEGYLEKAPEALAALNQGITTIISGQDGFSDPVDSLREMIKRKPAAINVATYTGHSSLRERVLGRQQLNRPATAAELKQMQDLLEKDIKAGSLGLSTGLEYEEGFYSSRHEVVELARTASKMSARYISHLRSEDVSLDDALDEIIAIGREAKLPVQISHFKIALKDQWGKAGSYIAQLERARAAGVNITADVYPYDFWNSTPRVLFPTKEFTSLKAAQYACDHLFDPAGSVMVRFAPNKAYEGKTVAAIAALRGQSEAQTLLFIIAAADSFRQRHPDASGVATIMGKSMSDDDVAKLLLWEGTNICSDGGDGGHPRGYGSFTRVLDRYVKQQRIMSWETAIHKMTGQAAEHTGIRNRGLLAPGYFADMVLIDPATVKDNASIEQSKALSDGISMVWVNGVLVYQDKQSTRQYPGMFVGK